MYNQSWTINRAQLIANTIGHSTIDRNAIGRLACSEGTFHYNEKEIIYSSDQFII